MQKKPTHNHLYEIHIDGLGLSEDAKKPLLKTGVESIGDVIDVMIRLNAPVDACDGFPLGISPYVDEIRECLDKHGYGKYYKA